MWIAFKNIQSVDKAVDEKVFIYSYSNEPKYMNSGAQEVLKCWRG